MKNLFKLSAVLGIVLGSMSCNDAPEIDPHVRLHVSNNVAQLSNRVNMINQAVGYTANGQGGVRGEAAISNQTQVDSEFTLVAQIESPNMNGVTLSATHVLIQGDQAYVTYHIAGDDYGGAVDVIDLSNENSIEITGQALYTDTDFNALAIDELEDFDGNTQRIFLVGANRKGALVEKLHVTDGIITEETESLQLDGVNANSAIRTKHMLYVTVGGRDYSSGLQSIDLRSGNNFFTLNGRESYPDAKFVATTGTDINDEMVVLRGGPGAALETYKVSSQPFKKEESYSIQSISTLDGKNAINIQNDLVFVAMSEQGMKVFDLTNIGAGPRNEVSSSELGGGYTNAVSTDDYHVYIANGISGLFVADLPAPSGAFELTGVLNLEGSANYVTSDNNYVIVANGTSGVQILKRTTAAPADNFTIEGFERIGGSVFESGLYGGNTDHNDMRNGNKNKMSHIYIPIEDYNQISEIKFDVRSTTVDYQIFVEFVSNMNKLSGNQAGDGAIYVSKDNSYSTATINRNLNKNQAKYVLLRAVPGHGPDNVKGRAYLTNISVTGN